MPFGATLLPGGGARFRLWAPAARHVELELGDELRPLERKDEGWFERVEAKARAGMPYRYRIDGAQRVPDPASRFQPKDAEGPSELVDPSAFRWKSDSWKGRPWHEAAIYELHVGTFTPQGTYAGVQEKLEHLRALGVTALELMPIADFCGRRGWGYDGVLPYAPESRYGRPEALKALVDAAHAAGLMVLLDVVYNHFGPQGNFLAKYAPQFFDERHRTPWGAAIDFASRWVREYFIHNALYWLGEYRFDGLRFDAVHAIHDASPVHILEEIASRARERFQGRHVHLILENEANQARFLGAGRCTAQWNDDVHHACHVLATGESDGYYAAYADAPARHLARGLAEGFAYQGEASPFTGKPRGEATGALGPSCFVNFLQNHDQVGNRALGERLALLAEAAKLRVLAAIVLLAPPPPMLFMGEEWGCKQPFLYFCDFGGELADAVREGRRAEFARFAAFADAAARSRIPDPLAQSTFKRSVLRWKDRDSAPGEGWMKHTRALLELRSREIVPRIARAHRGRYRLLDARAFEVRWPLGEAGELALLANLGAEPLAAPPPIEGAILWSSAAPGTPWSATWWLAA